LLLPWNEWVLDAKRRALAEYCGLGLIALALIAASVLAAPGLAGLLGAGLGVLMMTIAVVDARHFIIPNALTLAAFGIAVVNSGMQQQWEGVLMALLRAAVVALGFLIVRAGYQWLRGRQGIGLGDVKLAGVAGAWLGWTVLPIAIDIAAIAALAVYALRRLVGGRAVRRFTRVPFGLFFAPAIWLCWVLQTAFALT
jgi:leader peptidase (prepilin peptidase) / N-methyltransferase